MSRILLTALCLLIFACNPAAAQQGGFGEADADKDGKVTAGELKTYVSGKMPDFDRFDELMQQLDANNDKSLSAAEFEERMQGIQQVMRRPRPKKEASSEKKKTVEFADQYDARFAKRDPKIGSMMKNVSAFDGAGKPFALEGLKGKHAVIVFGCLT